MKKLMMALIGLALMICMVISAGAEEYGAAWTGFTTVDMEGNPVDDSIFAQADLTVLNIWGTYCSPCVSEMPELAAWANELPENVQLLGLVVDSGSVTDIPHDMAAKILESSGATFTNLLYNESLEPQLSEIDGTPTTLFLDSQGNQVHAPILFASVELYKLSVQDCLAQ